MSYSETMIYIVNEDLNVAGYEGVKKKVYGQIDAFSRAFGRVLLIYCAYGIVYLYEGKDLIDKKTALSSEKQFNAYLGWIKEYNCTKIYMRCLIPATYKYLCFLKTVKDMQVKLVLEYPTYPYEGEINNELIILEDREYRNEIKKYVDLATTYKRGEEVYGINTIILNNGLSLNANPVRKVHEKSKTINMLTVSAFSTHHGYERILEGLKNYYEEPYDYTIDFYMVGTGMERQKYEYLINKYDLSDHVKMCGVCVGEALDYYYNIADIGIGSMGLYKTKANVATCIKTKEYCGRGLPFIYGYEDEGFSGDEPYLVRVSNDSTPLDMSIVIDLYEKTVGNNSIILEMRKKAERHFSWDYIMSDIINYF